MLHAAQKAEPRMRKLTVKKRATTSRINVSVLTGLCAFHNGLERS